MMTDTLDVVARKESGSRHCRRLRREGMVPAILYGHGGACVELAASREAVEAVIRHGSRLVELRGAVKESAVVRELQWDAMGSEPIHLDLLRVSKTDRVRVKVPVDMKGECPGQRGGGVVTLVLHEIELECTADSIPDRVHVSIGALELGHAIKVRDLDLPRGVRALPDPDDAVVTCALPGRRAAAGDEPAAVTAEPEVIGRKSGEEAEAAEKDE
jgi:large subunit ribosomal protein L25